MKNFILSLALLLASFSYSLAYVIICPYEPNSSGSREGCLEIRRVNINGDWVEATCDNYTPPSGWFLHGCE